MNEYYIYIMASHSRTLYIGVTNNLLVRVYKHKNDLIAGFTKKYKIHKLVYWESCGDIESAIAREKQLKRWRRSKKIALIEQQNIKWEDLINKLAD